MWKNAVEFRRYLLLSYSVLLEELSARTHESIMRLVHGLIRLALACLVHHEGGPENLTAYGRHVIGWFCGLCGIISGYNARCSQSF